MPNPWKTGFGYAIARQTSAVQALQVLAQAFFFDACESDGALKFVPRGGDAAAAIPEDDLGLAGDGAKIQESTIQEQELPRSVDVTYADPSLDYQDGKQGVTRTSQTVRTKNQIIIALPLAIDIATAKQIAEKALYLAYLERRPYKFNLWKAAYLLLDPTDVVQFVFEGLTLQARIARSSLGASYVTAIEAVSEDAEQYISQAVGAPGEGGQPGTVDPMVDTDLFLMDVPLLRDADANLSGSGYYFAMRGADTPWPGAVLYKSQDDTTFSGEAGSNTPVKAGVATNDLAAPASPWAWDTVNSLTVTIEGNFASVTEAEILAGPMNALLVGSEVLQFRDALDNEDGTWTFSHLLRGRRGTDWAVDSHEVGERVVALSAGGIVHATAPLAVLDVLRYYRAVTVGQSIDAVDSEEFTITGIDLKPYSPVGIGTVEQSPATEDLYITWFRRTRFGGALGAGDFALTDGLGGPLNEPAELYEVDILDGVSVKRTIATTVTTAIYTEAMQIADWGSVQGSYDIKVYQISGAVGRGTPGIQTVPAETDAPVVMPGGGGFYIN